MKKLLFIIFFPITVPIYLLYKFFIWIGDTFIPFLQFDVFPLFTDKLFPVIKRYCKEKSAEMERNKDIHTKIPEQSNSVKEHENISINSNSILENQKIDYSEYPLADSDDPFFIRAMAVASYERNFTPYTLQKELKISYHRANRIIEHLLNSHLISPSEDEKYFSNVSFDYFNLMLKKIILENNSEIDIIVNDAFQSADVREKPKMNIEPLFKEAFYQYHEIDYEKKSTIVSIFTNKWRTICQEQFIVLDFETTGLSYVNDRIIEIAAIKYKNGIESDKFVHLVNPLMPIPAEATAINNITDEMVADADTERYLIPQLIEFLSDSLIVGHNVNFDLHFLEAAAQRYGYNVQYNYIDTVSVSKKIFPGLPNYKLTTIADNLGFEKDNMHRAETDVRVCAEIINIALNSLP